MKLTVEQYEQLLRPLANSRVSNRKQAGMTLAYLEAWDVRAHLIRIFGFGGWSADVLSADCMFEEQDDKGRWNVGYRVIMRLRLSAEYDFLCETTYTEAAVGAATLPQRGEAHDMAVKTAESDALKRAAINLGTQFGLSLYDNGNRNDVVHRTLREPEGYGKETDAVVVTAPDAALISLIESAESEETLRTAWDTAVAQEWLDVAIDGLPAVTLRNLITDRLTVLRDGEEA